MARLHARSTASLANRASLEHFRPDQGAHWHAGRRGLLGVRHCKLRLVDAKEDLAVEGACPGSPQSLPDLLWQLLDGIRQARRK
jgi:hypothetical protein